MLRIDIHHLVCSGGHFESKMAAKIQKSSDLGKILFPSRFCSCELISVIVFGLGAINDLQIISFLVIIIIILPPLLAAILSDQILRD